MYKSKNTLRLLIASLFALVLSACNSTPPTSTASADSSTPQYTVVKFHKDTCGTCKKMDAFLPAVEDAVSDKPVTFTQFDFTSEASQAKTEAFAKSKGLDKALNEHSGSGFVVIVDKDGNPVKKLSGKEYDQAAMIREIRAIAN